MTQNTIIAIVFSSSSCTFAGRYTPEDAVYWLTFSESADRLSLVPQFSSYSACGDNAAGYTVWQYVVRFKMHHISKIIHTLIKQTGPGRSFKARHRIQNLYLCLSCRQKVNLFSKSRIWSKSVTSQENNKQIKEKANVLGT